MQELRRHIGEVKRRRNQPVSILEPDKLDDAALERTYQETMRDQAQPADPISALLQQRAEFENR